jgi:hypothetical protein
MGGRPSGPIQPDPGVCHLSRKGDKELHVLGHWRGERSRCCLESCRWEKFIEHQKLVRKDLERFLKYVEYLNWYRQRKKIKESLQPQLQRRLDQQTKLEEWKEYYLYELCKLGQLERYIKLTRWESESTKNEIQYNMQIIAEEQKILLWWIERQLPLIASESAASCHFNGPGSCSTQATATRVRQSFNED